jgi:hypothetical protein
VPVTLFDLLMETDLSLSFSWGNRPFSLIFHLTPLSLLVCSCHLPLADVPHGSCAGWSFVFIHEQSSSIWAYIYLITCNRDLPSQLGPLSQFLLWRAGLKEWEDSRGSRNGPSIFTAPLFFSGPLRPLLCRSDPLARLPLISSLPTSYFMIARPLQRESGQYDFL